VIRLVYNAISTAEVVNYRNIVMKRDEGMIVKHVTAYLPLID